MPQGYHGIGAHGTPRGEVPCEKRHTSQKQRRSHDGGCVARPKAEQQAPQADYRYKREADPPRFTYQENDRRVAKDQAENASTPRAARHPYAKLSAPQGDMVVDRASDDGETWTVVQLAKAVVDSKPKGGSMFGRVTATPTVTLDPGSNLEMAVADLLAATDHPHIAATGAAVPGLRLRLGASVGVPVKGMVCRRGLRS